MRVRITRKLAQALNGLDLRPFSVGEVVDLADPLAQMLIAERWGEAAVAIDVQDVANDADNRPKPRRRPPDASGG